MKAHSRRRWAVLGIAVVAAVALIDAPASGSGYRATHVVRAQVLSPLTIKGLYSASFGLTSTLDARGGFVPPSGDSGQAVYACAGTGGGKYSSRGKVYTYISEGACGPLSFSFNPATWTATARGSLTSSWYKSVSKKSRTGRWVYTSRRNGHKTIAVSLTWKNPGSPLYGVTPYPAVGSVATYNYVQRPTRVAGVIKFKGAGLVSSMGSQPGLLRIEDQIGAYAS
jgi:hypothetical protein